MASGSEREKSFFSAILPRNPCMCLYVSSHWHWLILFEEELWKAKVRKRQLNSQNRTDYTKNKTANSTPKIDALKTKLSFHLNEEKWRAPMKEYWKTSRCRLVLPSFFQFHQIKEKIDGWKVPIEVLLGACRKSLQVCVCVHPFIHSIFQRLAILMLHNDYNVISSRGDFVKSISTTGCRLMAKPLPLSFLTCSSMVCCCSQAIIKHAYFSHFRHTLYRYNWPVLNALKRYRLVKFHRTKQSASQPSSQEALCK